MYTFVPTGSKVLVCRFEPEKKSGGGLVMPDKAQQQKSMGRVVAVGGSVQEFKPGNLVYFSKYGGTTVEDPGHELGLDPGEHLLLEAADLLGILEPSTAEPRDDSDTDG